MSVDLMARTLSSSPAASVSRMLSGRRTVMWAKGLVGDAQPLAAALGQARVARDKKLRERILLQQAEHLPSKWSSWLWLEKDQQRLWGSSGGSVPV